MLALGVEIDGSVVRERLRCEVHGVGSGLESATRAPIGPAGCPRQRHPGVLATHEPERPQAVRPPPLHAYKRPAPLILVNGLAEQSESWFANRTALVAALRRQGPRDPRLRRRFAPPPDRRRGRGHRRLPDRPARRLPRRVRPAPALQPRRLEPGRPGHPDLRRRGTPRRSRRLVLICPSGLHGDENLPMMEGVRRSQYDTLVKSVFHRSHFASDELSRPSSGSSRTASGRRACSGPSGGPSATRSPRSCARSRSPTL